MTTPSLEVVVATNAVGRRHDVFLALAHWAATTGHGALNPTDQIFFGTLLRLQRLGLGLGDFGPARTLSLRSESGTRLRLVELSLSNEHSRTDIASLHSASAIVCWIAEPSGHARAEQRNREAALLHCADIAYGGRQPPVALLLSSPEDCRAHAANVLPRSFQRQLQGIIGGAILFPLAGRNLRRLGWQSYTDLHRGFSALMSAATRCRTAL
jgi:hypothetical protein